MASPPFTFILMHSTGRKKHRRVVGNRMAIIRRWRQKDKIAKIDALLAVRRSNELEERLLAAENEHGIFSIQRDGTV